MKLSRRAFFKAAGVAGATTMAGRPAAAAVPAGGGDGAAMLVDTTLCLGCLGCESACSEANGLPEPVHDDGMFERARTTDTTAYTVVNCYESAGPEGEERYVKTQCMHCVAPACASACLVRALEKTPAGAVVYHEDRCLGCRYCMLSCPFDAPRFEYEKAVPYVRKCSFCAERQAQGQAPACAEACPGGALTFGRRSDLLEEARTRIYQNPGSYARKIFGERDAGGTSWLYITDARFEDLGFPDVGERSNAEATSGALAAVPLVMTMWPPLLAGLYAFSKRRSEVDAATREEVGHG
jgi:formate dehydrogenase iron-sulfur subunit